jgi:ferredoxin-NADP reductase
VTTPIAAPRIGWRVATVVEIKEETSTARTLVLDVPGWPGHLAGQHVDVRLTSDDGYQAERSYSIASPPEDSRLALTIERLPDGELSSYLCGNARVGDRFELRGPVGGYFVWRASDGGPLLLVAGGSGIVPLMCMLRHRARVVRSTSRVIRARLLYSSRSWADVIYRDELATMAAQDPTVDVIHTITRNAPAEWAGSRRRIDRAMLAEVAWPASDRPQMYICGPTALVESAANALVDLGYDPLSVKTERFGPTGKP